MMKCQGVSKVAKLGPKIVKMTFKYQCVEAITGQASIGGWQGLLCYEMFHRKETEDVLSEDKDGCSVRGRMRMLHRKIHMNVP